MEWSELLQCANRRDVVRLVDGRMGRILYAPIPVEERRGPAPRTGAGKAVVEIAGRHCRVAVEQIAGVVDAGRLVRPVEEQCGGKRNYDKHGAKRARDQAQATMGKRLDVYRCPHCDYWHLGQPQPRRETG